MIDIYTATQIVIYLLPFIAAIHYIVSLFNAKPQVVTQMDVISKINPQQDINQVAQEVCHILAVRQQLNKVGGEIQEYMEQVHKDHVEKQQQADFEKFKRLQLLAEQEKAQAEQVEQAKKEQAKKEQAQKELAELAEEFRLKALFRKFQFEESQDANQKERTDMLRLEQEQKEQAKKEKEQKQKELKKQQNFDRLFAQHQAKQLPVLNQQEQDQTCTPEVPQRKCVNIGKLEQKALDILERAQDRERQELRLKIHNSALEQRSRQKSSDVEQASQEQDRQELIQNIHRISLEQKSARHEEEDQSHLDIHEEDI